MTSLAHPSLSDLGPEACKDMPAEQRVFCFAMLVLIAVPFAYVGGVARALVWG